MDDITVIGLVIQSIAILGAIFVAFLRTKIQIEGLRKDLAHVTGTTLEQRADHKCLAKQVRGLSRTVARMEGMNHAPDAD